MCAVGFFADGERPRVHRRPAGTFVLTGASPLAMPAGRRRTRGWRTRRWCTQGRAANHRRGVKCANPPREPSRNRGRRPSPWGRKALGPLPPSAISFLYQCVENRARGSEAEPSRSRERPFRRRPSCPAGPGPAARGARLRVHAPVRRVRVGPPPRGPRSARCFRAGRGNRHDRGRPPASWSPTRRGFGAAVSMRCPRRSSTGSFRCAPTS